MIALLSYIFTSLRLFWSKHPALLYGIAALLGVHAAIAWNPILLLPFSAIILSLAFPSKEDKWKTRLLLFLLLAAGMFSYVSANYLLPRVPLEGKEGTAYIEIDSVSSSSTHFGKRWLYRGTMQTFISKDDQAVIAKKIPYSISIPFNDETLRPQANGAYLVDGILKESLSGHYSLSVLKDKPWYPVVGTWGLAEYRFKAKQAVSKYIHHYIHSERSSAFLTGIATGDFDDRQMQLEFGRFGLQHIMAISGFHFAIIAGILSLLFRLMMSKRRASLALIFLLSTYFLFLGFGPSVMRAWIGITIVLLGLLLERRGSGLNSLGAAILVVLLLDPLMIGHIGFQFSFIVTAAILLLYGVADAALQKVLSKRSLSEVVEMDTLNQHGYCLLFFFRQALALTIAVNLIALPLMLYYFGKFPVLSLLYNLFFPFLVSIAMLLLILGILGMIIFEPLGYVIHYINEKYTQFVLNFTYNLPTSFDVTLRVSAISVEMLIIYFCVLFGAAIFVRNYIDERRNSIGDFSFI